MLDVKKKTVFLDPRDCNNYVILHEMTHAYDWMLDHCYPYPLRDILIIRLYDKLKTKIEALDKVLMLFSHYTYQYNVINGKEGDHSTLFYMKCLDLELRLGVPFGTISGFPPELRIKIIRKKPEPKGNEAGR